ncbi:MAG: hypothetical protein DI585_02165 [Pseudomonas fluorescens]|nr:MAG: hypothetical protein DI585_02165 [Pseudomonas fluorescens]
MMSRSLLLCTLVVAVAGCSKKPEPDPNIALCPPETVHAAQMNQSFIDRVNEGETSAKPLKSLKGMQRRATLQRDGETMEVGFFVTGLPKCGWLPANPSLSPIVVRDGQVVATSAIQVRDLIAQGWVMKEAKWPWHNYEFGYLPRR